jgi:hypothetical protein
VEANEAIFVFGGEEDKKCLEKITKCYEERDRVWDFGRRSIAFETT